MNSSVLTMIVAPRGTSPRLALRAAGFIATSTSGASPGVSTSWSAKCSWKLETPGQGALGGADLGREVRQRRQVVAHRRGLAREAVPGELHPVARVPGETDHHAVERVDGLAAHCSPWFVGERSMGAVPGCVPRAQRHPSYVAGGVRSPVSTRLSTGCRGPTWGRPPHCHGRREGRQWCVRRAPGEPGPACSGSWSLARVGIGRPGSERWVVAFSEWWVVPSDLRGRGRGVVGGGRRGGAAAFPGLAEHEGSPRGPARGAGIRSRFVPVVEVDA